MFSDFHGYCVKITVLDQHTTYWMIPSKQTNVYRYFDVKMTTSNVFAMLKKPNYWTCIKFSKLLSFCIVFFKSVSLVSFVSFWLIIILSNHKLYKTYPREWFVVFHGNWILIWRFTFKSRDLDIWDSLKNSKQDTAKCVFFVIICYFL